MSVINRMEVSNCINLDNYQSNHKDWAPHFPYLEMNFRGLSTAIKATNGTGKTTLNNAYYALVTRDRSTVSKFKSRMAPKRKGVWSHFRLEMLYRTSEETLNPQLFGMEVDGEAWVFGMYGYSDDEVRFYCYRGYFEDCPLVTKDGHKRSLIHNEDFTTILKSQSDPYTTLSVADWKKAVGRHIDESLTHKMLAYHKAGGGDGTDNFFKVDRRAGEDYDTAFFYSHIAPETLVDCMGNYGDEDEHGFEDTLLKSARAILDAKHSVEKTAKEIKELKRTHGILSSAKESADQHRYAQESLAKEARETLAEYHFLRECTTGDPLPLLPVPMEQKSTQTQLVANGMVLQDEEWLLPDYVLSEITNSIPGDINRKAKRKKLAGKKLKRSQVIEIPCHSFFSSIGERGPESSAYCLDEALIICQESERFAENWSRDAALRAINYAWDWRTGDGEHNVFRKLRKESETEIEELGHEIQKDENDHDEKTESLQRLNGEIQEIELAASALSEMRRRQLFTQDELASPFATGEVVDQELRDAKQSLKDLDNKNVALEDGRQAYARVVKKFEPKSPKEARDTLSGDLESANQQSSQAKQEQSEAKEKRRLARREESKAQAEHESTIKQKGEIDILVPHMRKFESLFPDEDPCVIVETVPKELEQAKTRISVLPIQIKEAIELADQFSALAPGVTEYREIFNDETPQGLAEKVTRALSDAEHRAEQLKEKRERIAETLCSLTEGQTNLRIILGCFGDKVNVATLERDLEGQENNTTQTLFQLGEEIKRLNPLVNALDEFERRYSNASPAEIEQQREARRNDVVVRVNTLKSDRDRISQQKTNLEDFGAAAGRIASEVLACVGGNPLLVHQAIEGMDLPPDRKQAATVHFSHVLYSPVYRDPVQAAEALENLFEAGIEAPIFDFDGLGRFCRDGVLSWKDGQARGLLAGTETLQVKAILDPSYIPDLIRRFQKQIEDIEEKLVPLEEELIDLSSDSELSKTIAQARTAVEERARVALDDAETQRYRTEEQLERIQNNRSDDVIQSIRLAASYIEAGGDETLESQYKLADSLKDEAATLIREMPEFKKRASKNALSAIQSMLEYAKLGGTEKKKCNAETLKASKAELEDIEQRLPRLVSRFNKFSIITKAKEFVEFGGWEKAQTLDSQIAQAIERLEKARGEVNTAEVHVNRADELVESADERVSETSIAESLWRSDLQRAIQFEDDGGISFDATYKVNLNLAQEAERLADKRSRFQFSQAQQAADAENDPLFRENKVKQRDDLDADINNLSSRIADCRKDQDAARRDVEKYRIAADKTDTAAKYILDQWKDVREIIKDLPSDQRGEVGTDNMFVNDSRRAASDMRDVCEKEQWEDALEELEGLAENILQFPLNQRRSAIKELSRKLSQALRRLKIEVKNILDIPDNSLSEGEIEALANPKNEADLAQSVLNLHRIIEEHLLKAEHKHEFNQKDVEENKQRMLASMAGFTDNVQENFDLLKRVMSTRGGGASIKISGTVIGTEGMRDKLDKLIEEIDTQLSRRREDLDTRRIAKESEQAFHDRLRDTIRSDFYRTAFRAPESSNASGPRVSFNHPQIGGGRDIPLSKEVSTGQFNALTLLILVKLADFSMRRDARNDYDGMTISRAKRVSSARTVMIDGLFSNLSDKKMIRESLNVLRSLKGSFQLIGWIHNQQYENDHELFPACVTIRRTGIKRGYVLAENVDAPPLPETEEVAVMEAHITPIESKDTDDA